MRIDNEAAFNEWLTQIGHYGSRVSLPGFLQSNPKDHAHKLIKDLAAASYSDHRTNALNPTFCDADVLRGYIRERIRTLYPMAGKSAPQYQSLDLGTTPITVQTKADWRPQFPQWVSVIERPEHLQAFLNSAFPSDFIHMSYGKPGQVAYTASPEHLAQDRQTITTLGRYLSRRFPELPSYLIAALGNRFARTNNFSELKFARTRDEIRYVYENGPGSCMGKGVDNFSTDGVHPAEAYASGHWAVAYAENANGDITARAVVSTKNPEDQRYSTIYGNEDLLTTLLENEGWKPGIDFTDHEFLAIKVDGEYVGPYVDGTNATVYTIPGKPSRLVIHPSATLTGCSVGETQNSHDSGGFFADGGDREDCESCGRRVNTEIENYLRDRDGDLICDECLGDDYVEASDGNHWETTFAVHVDSPDLTKTADGKYFIHSRAAASAGYVYCEPSDDWRKADSVQQDPDTQDYACSSTFTYAPFYDASYTELQHSLVNVCIVDETGDFEDTDGRYPEDVIEGDSDFELIGSTWVYWPESRMTQEQFHENQAA